MKFGAGLESIVIIIQVPLDFLYYMLSVSSFVVLSRLDPLRFLPTPCDLIPRSAVVNEGVAGSLCLSGTVVSLAVVVVLVIVTNRLKALFFSRKRLGEGSFSFEKLCDDCWGMSAEKLQFV